MLQLFCESSEVTEVDVKNVMDGEREIGRKYRKHLFALKVQWWLSLSSYANVHLHYLHILISTIHLCCAA